MQNKEAGTVAGAGDSGPISGGGIPNEGPGTQLNQDETPQDADAKVGNTSGDGNGTGSIDDASAGGAGGGGAKTVEDDLVPSSVSSDADS